MAYFTKTARPVSDAKESSKFLAVVFGYMAIALLVTAASTIGFGFWFSNLIVRADDSTWTTMFIVMAVSGVALLIDSFVMSFQMARSKKGAWIPYIIYAFIMGVFLSTFVMWIDAWTIGMAFGITCALFLVMFLIGYFSKANLTPLGFVAFSILIGVMLASIPFAIIYFVGSWSAIMMYDYIVSIVLIIAMVLMVAFDANRMKREIQGGYVSSSTALYYAFSFYTDFITMFVRILYILAISNSRN